MTTLEDLLARYEAEIRPEVRQALIRDARRAAREVWHRCSHGELVACGRHRDPENQPGWIDALPLRTRRTETRPNVEDTDE